MDILGFGRVIDPESQQAMREGSRLHKVFQEQLLSHYAMAQVEVSIKDSDRGVSGRMDALLATERGSWVVEYKTVSEDRFQMMELAGPFLSHWAQLHLYLMVGGFAGGSLVVDSRGSGARRIFQVLRNEEWEAWIDARIRLAKDFQQKHALPSREISAGCRSCDRWKRCFKTEAARDEAVMAHPEWDPSPEIPQETVFARTAEIV